MKKKILALAAVCVAACCLGACDSSSNIPANDFDKLNAMLHADYSRVVITVTDTFDENTSLTSEYAVNYSDDGITVNYVVEKFAELSLDDPQEDVKRVLRGEALIQGGAVVSVEGDDIGLTAEIAEMGFVFQEDYFENVELTGIQLKADVKEPAAFFGLQMDCTDMKVAATFLDVFFDINITYTSASGQVEYTYAFEINSQRD